MVDGEQLAHKQAQLLEQAQKVLHLTEPYYPVRQAARLLGISRSLLYEYLSDPRLSIERLRGEEHGRRFIWARDIERIWVIRHSVSPKRSA